MRPRQIICISLLTPLLGLGCFDLSPDPVTPTWDVEISAALGHSKHSIIDLVTDIASLPPGVLDTLDLSKTDIRFEQTVVLGDTTADNTNDSLFSGNFFHGVSRATIYVQVENGTPVNLDVSVTLLDESLQSLLRVPRDSTYLFLPASPIDATGKTGPATTALSVVEIVDPDVASLDRAGFLLYTIELSFPAGVRYSNIVDSDSVDIRSWGTFQTRVNQ